MSDVNVTFSAKDEGLSTAIANWRREMGMGAPGTPSGYQPVTPPFGLGGPPPVPGPLTQAAMAQVAAKKRLAEQNRETAQSEETVAEATTRTQSRFERLTSRIVESLVIWQGIRLAIDAVKSTFDTFAQTQFEATKFQNIAQGITNTTAALEMFRRVADETKQSTAEVTEQALKLHEAGIPYEEQEQSLRIIGEMARVWGENADQVATMVAHIREGTASEQELEHIAMRLGGDFALQAQAYRDMVVQAPYLERSLQRSQTLMSRQYEDQQRLTGARNEFFERAGLVEKVFGEMIKRPANYDKEQLTAMTDTWRNRENLMKQFHEGISQLSTETGLDPGHLQDYINSGVYGAKDLIEASGRYRAEQKRHSDRAVEDQRYSIEQAKDDTKLQMLRAESDAFADSVKAQETLNRLAGQFIEEQKTIIGQQQMIGREIQGGQENAGKTTEHVKGWVDKVAEAVPLKERWGGLQPWELPKPPSGPAPWDTEAWINRRMGGAAQPSGGEEKTAPILQQIEGLLRLVFGIPTMP